jgi:tRNA threonylcarbamoyladenosine biosynthesis protein TsaB
MRALALDTTTRGGSVALVDDDTIVDERRGDDARSHAERLPAALIAIVTASDLSFADIDVFAVASGPGSFTGLRIGIATIQGLALVTGRQAAGIPALDALGHAGSLDVEPGGIVAAWMDALRRDVFAALYRVTPAPMYEARRLEVLDAASVGDPASVLARWRDRLKGAAPVFVGDGAVAYADQITNSCGAARIVAPPLLAGVIGRLAIAQARRGEAVHPGAIRPTYVRRPDAELTREMRQRGGHG